MSRNRWLERPWLIALGVLAVALLPVALGFLNFRAAIERSDRELLETTTRLAQQSLRLATVRHINLLMNFRGQLSMAADPASGEALNAFRQREGQMRFAHWTALAYAENVAENEALVRWFETPRDTAPIHEGDNLAAEPRLQNVLSQAQQRPFQQFSAAWGTNQIAVAGAVLDIKRTRVRGFVIGWLDLDGLCHDPQLPLVIEGALTLTPMSEKATPPVGTAKLRIEEAGMVWHARVARGPRFAAVFARPTPWLVLAGGTTCATLLATLAWLTARSRQQNLRTAELNAALEAERELGRLRSHFVNSVSHEFRTPLSVILSSADLLENYAEQLTPARRHEVLAQIQDSTRHMTQMVEEILLLGRIESRGVKCRPAPLDVGSFCKQLAAETITAHRERTSIQIEVATGLENVPLDSALLRSILGNLLANAVKYSAPGRAVQLTAVRVNGSVNFTVRDEGIGISANDLPHLGGPFYRGRNVGDTPGTGLGLAIVQRCATLHGGTFHIESLEGRGTTAQVSLPSESRDTENPGAEA
jgi:signal transduction histidine kinase